jgi:phenylacetic acid degradation operon negative regulatory protein
MKTDTANDLISCLRGDQALRAPSLLVTVFGDLAQGENARIGAGALGRILDGIGVRPEAMRVALHRLRKEGWIESHRTGRSSAYCLTAHSRLESFAATPRIYSAEPPASEAWLVLADPAKPQLHGADGVSVCNNVTILAEKPKSEEVYATHLAPGTELPAWIRRKVCDASLVKMSEELAMRLKKARALYRPGLGAIEVAILRVLIVHGWRRIVLNTPCLPDYVFPSSWQGPMCRVVIQDLLARLPRPNIAELEEVAIK